MIKDKKFWQKAEIIVAFIAMAFFALCEYERADFLMLFLIYNRLIKETDKYKGVK